MYKNASRFQQVSSRRSAFEGKNNKAVSRYKEAVPQVLKRAFSSQELVLGVIEDYNEAGFLVGIEDFLAFCPFSLMYPIAKSYAEKQRLLGRGLEFVVKEVKINSVVLSRIAAIRKRLIPKMQAARDNRSILSGTITHVEKYGAFVDLDGIGGLVHISEVSDQWIDDLTKVLPIGSKAHVVVLAVDTEKERLALSMRQVPK